MRIILATYGTTGDVQPMLALACELVQRGHSAPVAAAPNYRDRAEALGLEFVPLGPVLDDEETKQIFGSAMKVLDPAVQLDLTLHWATRHLERMFEELCEACRGADALLSIPFQFAGHMVHEALGIPLISFHFSPFFGKNKRMAELSSGAVNPIRTRLGLSPVEDPLGPSGMSSLMTLVGVSPHIFPKPRGWPATYHVTGFWFLDLASEKNWTPDADLMEFVDSHQPLVVVTTGSMYHDDSEAVGRMVVEAMQMAGCAAVVQRGFSGLAPGDTPSNIHLVGYVPHSWLFQEAKCVVHIGGSGVTGATLRAGVPSVVIPHWQDQHLFGHLLTELRCAGGVIPFPKLTAEKLGAAVRKTLDSPKCAAAAEAVGARVATDNGVKVASELIEQILGRREA